MKKRLTRGEKWLFASPLALLIVAGIMSQWRKAGPLTVELPRDAFIYRMEFAPDSQRMVVSFLDGATSRPINRVFDLETRSKVCDLEAVNSSWHSENVEIPFWSNDGSLIGANTQMVPPVSATAKMVAAGGYLQIAVWDATSGILKWKHQYKHPESEPLWEKVRFSENNSTFIGEGIPPAVYDVASGKRLNKPDKIVEQNRDFRQNLHGAQLSQNGKWLARRISSQGEKQEVEVLDFETKKSVWKLPVWKSLQHLQSLEWNDETLGVLATQYTADGTAFERNALWLWDARTRQLLPSPTLPRHLQLADFKFNPQQRALAYGYITETEARILSEINVWDYQNGRMRPKQVVKGKLQYLRWSPDGKRLLVVTAGSGCWGLNVFNQDGSLQLETEMVTDTANWSPDGRLAFQPFKVDTSQNGASSNTIEIVRFED